MQRLLEKLTVIISWNATIPRIVVKKMKVKLKILKQKVHKCISEAANNKFTSAWVLVISFKMFKIEDLWVVPSAVVVRIFFFPYYQGKFQIHFSCVACWCWKYGTSRFLCFQCQTISVPRWIYIYVLFSWFQYSFFCLYVIDSSDSETYCQLSRPAIFRFRGL